MFLYIFGKVYGDPMSEKLIVGRKREISLLNRFIDSDEAEFVAVYGRRRVGKTYLVKGLFQKNFSFYMTGLANSDLKKQLQNCTLYTIHGKRSMSS